MRTHTIIHLYMHACMWHHQGIAQSNVWHNNSNTCTAVRERLCLSTVYLRVPKHICVHFLQFWILQPLLYLQMSHYPCFGRLVLIAKWLDLAQRLVALTQIGENREKGIKFYRISFNLEFFASSRLQNWLCLTSTLSFCHTINHRPVRQLATSATRWFMWSYKLTYVAAGTRYSWPNHQPSAIRVNRIHQRQFGYVTLLPFFA